MDLIKATWWNRFWYLDVLTLGIMLFAFFPSVVVEACSDERFVFFSLGSQKHNLLSRWECIKSLTSVAVLSCAVVIRSASLLSQQVLAALFFLCRWFSKGKSNMLPLWYGYSWNALLHYLCKYVLVLSIVLVRTALGSVTLVGPNFQQQIFEAVLSPFDLFWHA